MMLRRFGLLSRLSPNTNNVRFFSSSGSLVQPIRSSYGLWIDGKEDFGNGETIEVTNPATGDYLTKVTACSAEDVNKAVASAKAAFNDGRWSKLPPRHRCLQKNYKKIHSFNIYTHVVIDDQFLKYTSHRE